MCHQKYIQVGEKNPKAISVSFFFVLFKMGDKSLEDLMRRRLAQWKMRTTNEHIGPGRPALTGAVKRIMTGNVRDIGVTYLTFGICIMYFHCYFNSLFI